MVRVGPAVTLPFVILALACGGVSKHHDGGDAAPSTDDGGTCAEPASLVPEIPPYTGAPLDDLPTFLVTFHNQCVQTVWPAWGATGGLENGVIDGRVWLPLPAGDDRTVTVHGGVRELGFWGRTACSFDATGDGTCLTGDCGGFICSTNTLQFPPNATVYSLESGFLGGYNLGMHIVGPTCGEHECVTDLRACTSGVKDACGTTVACDDICATSACCEERGCSDGDFRDGGDVEVTFCP